MKIKKLPRKLKASLKKEIIKKTGNSEWQTNEVKIYGYDRKKKRVTSLTMGL